MIYFLTSAITALGLGFNSGGLRLLTGLLLIPIGLFFGNLVFQVPLGVMGKILAGIAVIRLGIELIREAIPTSKRGRFQRSDCKFWLLHPLSILSGAFLIPYFLLIKKPFTLHEWDEFSHWGLMPKQIYLFDQVSTLQFPYTRFLEYTPGWPLLLDFPFFVWGGPYETRFLLFTVVLMSIGLAGSVWDFFQQASRQPIFAWLVILVLARLHLGIYLYPTDILSEGPLEILFCTTVLLAFSRCAGESSQIRPSPTLRALSWGILLSGGFLIKKSFMGILLFFVAACLNSGGRLNHGSGQTPRRWTPFISFWLPWIFVLVIWHLTTRLYPHIFKWVERPAGVIHLPLLLAMISKAGSFLVAHFFLSAIAILGFFEGLRQTRYRPFFGILFATDLIYLTCLYWLYLTTFPGQEGMELASFDRYFQSLFKLNLFAVFLFLFAASQNFFKSSSGKLRRRILIGATLVFALANAEQFHLAIHILNKWGEPSPFVAQAPRLIQLLEAQHLRGETVGILYEGIGPIAHWQATYAAIDRAGPLAFQATFIDPEAFPFQQSVIWPIQISAKGEQTLRKRLLPTCPGELTDYFWIKEGFIWKCAHK